MLVNGQSGCGKTDFVCRLIRAQKHNFKHVLFAYAMYQPIYETLCVELVQGLPSNVPNDCLLILDDMMFDCNKDVASLFTRMRHANVSTIFIVQDMYFDNKYLRTINRNSHYKVLYPNPGNATMLRTQSYQVYPDKPKFILNAFEKATAVPFGYLFLDLKPNVKHRVKTGILPGEDMFIFMHDGEYDNTDLPNITASVCSSDLQECNTEPQEGTSGMCS